MCNDDPPTPKLSRASASYSCPDTLFLHCCTQRLCFCYTRHETDLTSVSHTFVCTFHRFAAARSFLFRLLPVTLLHPEAADMVYITPGLFGPVDTHNSPHHHWHIMSDSHHDPASLGKRKRSLDGDSAHSSRGSRPQHTSSLDRNSDHTYSLRATDQRPLKQTKRLSPKLALVKSTPHLTHTETSTSPAISTSAEVQPHAVDDLRACHACRSAPKRRKDLENYMDCKRCVGRTCYICARQCLGGCGRKVCKECTAEIGQEGDSWCLDCLQQNQYMT